MKRNSKQFLALFMAVAMSVTPVSYAYAEDSAVAGVENTESGQQTVEIQMENRCGDSSRSAG